MGAVYDIYLELKGEPNKDEIVRQTKRFIEDYKDATFDVAREGENEFIKTLRIIFTDSFGPAYVEEEDGTLVPSDNRYTADFSARYAWHSVMEDWFGEVAPVLGNGTTLNIWSDDGDTFGIVYNGRAYFRYDG